MRRTNEAFRNEVFRRYQIEKRNRRNLRIYAATSVLLCLLVVGIAVPYVTGKSLPETVASWVNSLTQGDEPNELSEYLNDSVEDLRIINRSTVNSHDCNEDEIRETVDLLVALSISELDSPPEAIAFSYRIHALTPACVVNLSVDPSGYLQAEIVGKEAESREIRYFSVSESDLPAMLAYLKRFVGESEPVTTPSTSEPKTPITDETVSSAVLRSYLDQPMKEIQYQLLYEQSSLSSITEPSEIDTLVAKLKQLSLTPELTIELAVSGPCLDLYLEDGRMIELDLHSDGWLCFRMRDAELNTVHYQWYSLSENDVEDIRQHLTALTPPETNGTPMQTSEQDTP